MSFTCGNLSIFFSNVKKTSRDMRQQKIYEANDKMITLIKDNYNVLQSLGCFGISLGFGDKTVSQVCEEQQVDTTTFLAVVNYTINGERPDIASLNLSLPTLLRYLKASHDYYTGFQLPFIRKELNDAIDPTNNLGKLIMKLYDQYSHSITSHMKYEERNVFPYVEQLMNGTPDPAYDIDTYSKHHSQETDKLYELKSIIIKYLPADGLHNNKLSATLYDIYNNEDWLRLHAEVEEYFLIPAIRQIEEKKQKRRHRHEDIRHVAEVGRRQRAPWRTRERGHRGARAGNVKQADCRPPLHIDQHGHNPPPQHSPQAADPQRGRPHHLRHREQSG